MSAQRQFNFDVRPKRNSSLEALDALMAVGPGFDAHATSSPARSLQAELECALAADETKWPVGHTVLLLLVTCGGFWFGVASLVVAAL